MKTLLTITPFYRPNLGGVETHLTDLTRLIEEETDLHHVVATYTPLTVPVEAPRQEPLKNGLIFRLPWPGGRWFYRFEPYPPLQLAYLFPGLFLLSLRLARRFRASLAAIHGHGLTALVIVAALKNLFSVKTFVSLHTIYKFSDRPMIASVVRWLSTRVDQYFVLAEACRQDLIAIGVPGDKIVTYSNWVETDKTFVTLDQPSSRRELGLPENGFIALFLARLSKEKGLGVVLDTIDRMPHPAPLYFLLVGDGPMAEEVNKRLGHHPEMLYRGAVTPAHLPLYYNAANVLLMGSVDGDYFGRVTMESLACGLPVILPRWTEYFGMRKPIDVSLPNDRVGMVIEPTPEQLESLLKKLASQPALSHSLPAREFALAHFGKSQSAPFLTAYKSL